MENGQGWSVSARVWRAGACTFWLDVEVQWISAAGEKYDDEISHKSDTACKQQTVEKVRKHAQVWRTFQTAISISLVSSDFTSEGSCTGQCWGLGLCTLVWFYCLPVFSPTTRGGLLSRPADPDALPHVCDSFLASTQFCIKALNVPPVLAPAFGSSSTILSFT